MRHSWKTLDVKYVFSATVNLKLFEPKNIFIPCMNQVCNGLIYVLYVLPLLWCNGIFNGFRRGKNCLDSR